jgi:hypothetical protein
MAEEPAAAERPGAKLRTLLNDAWIPQAICAAAELGIPDLLARGPASADELAAATGAHAPSLRRLLSALVTIEIVREHDDGRFDLTPMGALLRADTEESLHARALWVGRYQWPLWGRLADSVRSGDSARKLLSGTEGFAHLARDPEQAAVFNRAMAELTRAVVPQVARAYDFSRMRMIVDLGGGYGELITAILAANPRLHGVLFDLAHAADEGRRRIAGAGLADRCAIVTGDFFASIPSGADAYLLKSVIHDWDDARAAILLGNVRRAMEARASLLLVERILPERFTANAADRAIAGRDLNMLVSLGAKERTEAQFRELLAGAGFRLVRILPVGGGFCVLEASSA